MDTFQWIKRERGHKENVTNSEVVNRKGEKNGYQSMEGKRVG